jgi:hypothetical protein
MLEQLALLLAGHLYRGSVLIVGLLALSLPLCAILAVRMPNVAANAKAATVMAVTKFVFHHRAYSVKTNRAGPTA